MAAPEKVNLAVVGGSLILAALILVMLSRSQSDFYELAVELDEKGGRADATITEVDCTVTRSVTQERGLTSSESCDASVSFRTPAGETIESTMPSGLPRGTVVPVLYDPDQPERFVPERHLREGGGMGQLVIGLLLGVAGLALIFLELRNRKRTKATER